MIAAQVLSASRAGARKTGIMYRANLSFEQLGRYLRRLVDLDLLTYDEKSRLYTATPRGLLYLENFTELQGITEALSTKKATLLTLVYHDKNGTDRAGNSENQDVGGFLLSRLGKGAPR